MDAHVLLTDIKEMGPALSAIVVVGVLCYTFIKLFSGVVYKLLDLLNELSDSIKAINDNTTSNTRVLNELARSIESINRTVERLVGRNSR
mgnify:CR=1 FL=1